MIGDEELRNRFIYHAPSAAAVASNHREVAERTLELARWIDALLPDGREKSLAITHLEEVRVWANAGVARNQVGAAAPPGDPT